MERQKRYTEAVLFCEYRFERFRALQLASKYIGQKYILCSDITEPMIKYGKQQVEIHSGKGPQGRERLLTIINVISPKLQVQYLEKVQAYRKAVEVLKEIGRVDHAFDLMLKHAMYMEAFDLAKEQKDTKKQHKVILSATRFKLSCHKCHCTEVPDLKVQLETMCCSENIPPSVRGMANLLKCRLSGESSYSHEALKIFQEKENILGECEALVLYLPKLEKNMETVESMLNLCIKVDKLCSGLMTRKERDTASLSHTMEQVEEFYGFVKERNEYIFQLHQDVWKIMEREQEGNPTQLQLPAHKVCRAVSAHLKSHIKVMTGNKECWKVVQNEIAQFDFHHKLTEQPFATVQAKLSDYVKLYSMSLELISHNEKCGSLEEWKRHLFNFIRYNGLILNRKHFDRIKYFPSALKILENRLNSLQKEPVINLSLDDWMEMWILSQSLNQNDQAVVQQARPVPTHQLVGADEYFYVPSSDIGGIEHKVPHFFQWIKFCQLLREGSKAKIAVKILTKYIEIIARRVSIRDKIISVSNPVMMLSMSSMIFYAFHILSLPQQAIVIIPQILIDTVKYFDQKNCLSKKDPELLQSCFNTFWMIAKNATLIGPLRTEAQEGIEHVLKLFTGVYRKEFNILHLAVKNEAHNNIVTCLTLGLTLLGNLAISSQYRPSDLLEYQHSIHRALQPLMEHPNHHLRGICERFQRCTSAKDIFDLVVRLNVQYYKGQKQGYLFNLQALRRKMNLMPYPLTRVPQRSVLPLAIKRVNTPNPTAAEKVESVRSDKIDSAKNEDVVETDNEIERQESEEFDEDVKRALTYEETEQVEMVERQVSVDNTLVDEDYCTICKTALPKESALKEHIDSSNHKTRMTEYNTFIEMQKNVSKKIQEWEKDIKYLKLFPKVTESGNEVIFEVQYQIKQLEKVFHNTEKDGNWKEGEDMLLSLESKNISISKQLQESIERADEASERMQQTKPADTADEEVRSKLWPIEASIDDQSDEEALSGIEDEEVTPKQAKINIKKVK